MIYKKHLISKACIQGGATTLYVSSNATQPVMEKCSPPLIHPPSQQEADENSLAQLTKLNFSQTGSVAYDDTYRVVAPPWMQALLIRNICQILRTFSNKQYNMPDGKIKK